MNFQAQNDSIPGLQSAGVSRTVDAALLAALLLAFFAQVVALARIDVDIAGVFLRALFISTILSSIPISILWFLDRRERENPWVLAAAFLWGGLIATTLSLPLNSAAFRAVDRWLALNPVVSEILGPNAVTLIAAPLSAPIVEEIAKGMGVCLILWMIREKFDGMRDGFIYGALVGVGFNWFEAPLYVMQGFAEHGMAPYSRELGVRHGILGLGGHALFSGVFGLSLGLAVQTSRRWLKLVAPPVGLLIAVAAHLFNNSLPLFQVLLAAPEGQPAPQELLPELLGNDVHLMQAMLLGSVPQLTIFLPLTIIVLFGIWRSGVWERRIIREELASEVGRSVTASEYREVLQDQTFRTRRDDKSHPKLSREIVKAQNELAFRKHRVRRRSADPETDSQVIDARQVIERLRSNAADAS